MENSVVDRPATPAERSALAAQYPDWRPHSGTVYVSPDIKQQLTEQWRRQVRFMPLFLRAWWLQSSCGQIVHGESQRNRMLAELEARIKRKLSEMPSATWAEDWGMEDRDLPRLTPSDRLRRFASHMKRRRKGHAVFAATHLPRRWTPDIAFESEIKADEIPIHRAWNAFRGEGSISAAVIEQIAMVEATEQRWAHREDQVGIETFDERDKDVLYWRAK